MRTEGSRPLPRVRLGSLATHLVLALGAIAMFAPFVWMVLTGFKTLPQILKEPLSFIPDPWTTQNFTSAWTQAPFVQAYANSAYITIAIVCGSLITTSMAGYAFARIDFPASRWLFGVVLVSQMIPKQVTLVPFYLLMAKIGWVDSHLALIIPGILVNPFGVFLARQFILSIPKELEEAATVDGASRLRIYWQIILPLIRPGLGALAIIVALDAWNNFLLPLVLLNRSQLFTVPLLLSQFQGQFGGINTGLIMAATAVSTIPMLIAFVIGQKQIMSSLASSGLGGR
ncbi:carbohydrate ABC transporter permease [Schaalia hyovaginalis]|uniref:carbohydrate ABC transporter permease n=1 Tax=Schaalia hyovaginalis TaxID=29316 RepID=UPI0012B1B844|nr:carbohydrate ABC transporter permease [Schaalia hyovaginalis]MDY3664517.1 carbohydrate ABC transporter permease [Schaalia hyovaginalis]MST63664.1 carbohydrate ABC transporter permease [Schaalia hyovaginalis]